SFVTVCLTRLLHRGTTQIRDAYRQEKAPASSRPTFCYSFRLDRSRNEFRNVEKFSGPRRTLRSKSMWDIQPVPDEVDSQFPACILPDKPDPFPTITFDCGTLLVDHRPAEAVHN